MAMNTIGKILDQGLDANPDEIYGDGEGFKTEKHLSIDLLNEHMQGPQADIIA